MKFNSLFKYCFFIILFIGSSTFYCQNESEKSQFDFSNVDFTKDISIELNGNWDFVWDTLAESDDFPLEFVSVAVPGFWKNYEENKYTAVGFGTYRTVVKLGRNHPLLAFHLGDIHNAYNFFINGKLVKKVGNVATSKGNSVARWIPQIIIVEDTSSVLEIILQVSNFRHRNGGVQHSIKLGNADYILEEKESITLADLFLGGATLVIGLFFFGMYFFWKKDKSALFFGLFCFSFGTRVLIVGSRSLILILQWLPWEIAIRIEYLALFFSALFFLHFIYNSFRAQTSKLLVKIVSYFYYAIILSVIVLPGTLFTYSIFPNNILLIVLIVYALIVYIKALKSKVFGAGWAMLSFVIFFVAVGLSIAEYANLFIPSPIMVSAGFVAFIFTMSLIFAARFGKAFSDVESLKIKAEIQNEKISEQHDLIKDSIQYARRIQRSLLPSIRLIKEKLPNSMIYYNPQSVVSGDFYWFKYLKNTNEVVLAISDCTGHGVPGAFMSIVGISSLDKIIAANSKLKPSKILEKLNEEIRIKLNTDSGGQVLDGMDIIICKISLDTKEVEFSSALHKLVLLRNKETILYNGCRHFIGSKFKENFKFIEHKIKLEKNDQIFMFSDGIYDQKGGEKGKKLYFKNFEKMLIEMSMLPVEQQESFLSDKVSSWKGEQEQLDDMLVFGWKIS